MLFWEQPHKMGIRTHLIDEETEAQHSLRSQSWYTVRQAGRHARGPTAATLWAKLDLEKASVWAGWPWVESAGRTQSATFPF